MIINNKHFTLTDTAIDLEAIEYAPCEGSLIPLNIDAIEGLRESIPNYGFGTINGLNVEPREIMSMYIYHFEESDTYALCINYTADGMQDTECIFSPNFQIELNELKSIKCSV